MQVDNYIEKLTEFLLSPLPKLLLSVHPNEAALKRFKPPSEWECWWDWAPVETKPWQSLFNHHPSEGSLDVPPDLRNLIDNVRALQLVREQGSPVIPGFVASSRPSVLPWYPHPLENCLVGMSPKKSHEVSNMLYYITQILRTSTIPIKHIVDVGAGQGYLSRALQVSGLHVLALDSSETQARGAKRRHATRPVDDARGSLTYNTINITPSTLSTSIDEWVGMLTDGQSVKDQAPVMIVALHACGSLTPDILRASFSMLDSHVSRQWALQSVVVVGCCYNLMSAQDYALSNSRAPRIHLTSSHLQLSSQVPFTWLQTSSNGIRVHIKAAEGIKKVAWRAMLEGLICEQPSLTPEKRRLGKLNDKSYTDWSTFLVSATARFHISPLISLEEDRVMERRLSTLHVLRCFLGPCVESLIIWDRYIWAMEFVKKVDLGLTVELVNLFDQKQGSGRNIAIVIKPR